MDRRAVLEIIVQRASSTLSELSPLFCYPGSNTGTPFSRIILRVQHRLEGSQHTERASTSNDFHLAHLDPLISSLPLDTISRSGALQRRRRKVAAPEEEFGEDPFDFIDDPYQSKPPLSMGGPC